MGRSVKVRGGRRRQSPLGAEIEQELRLRPVVRGVEALDSVEVEVVDQGGHLAGLAHVPERMGEDGRAAGAVDDLRRLGRIGPATGDERLRPGHQPLLEESAHLVGLDAGGLGDVRAADRGGIARLGDRVLESDRDTLGVESLDDLLRSGDPLALGALACRRDGNRVHPVAEHVHVIGASVNTGHLGRGHKRQSRRLGCLGGLRYAIDAVVVGERERRDTRLRGTRDDLRRRELAVGVGRMALQVQHRRRSI